MHLCLSDFHEKVIVMVGAKTNSMDLQPVPEDANPGWEQALEAGRELPGCALSSSRMDGSWGMGHMPPVGCSLHLSLRKNKKAAT